MNTIEKISNETKVMLLMLVLIAALLFTVCFYDRQLREETHEKHLLEIQLYNDSIYISELQDSLAICKEHLELNTLTIRFLNDEICYIKGITREDCYYDKNIFLKIKKKLNKKNLQFKK